MKGKFTGWKTVEQTVFLDGLILLSQIFRGPDPDLCEEMASPGFTGELKGFTRLLGAGADADAGILIESIEEGGKSGNLGDFLEACYVRLFINAPGGSRAPLYHSFYDSDDQLLMGRPALMMKDLLQRHGILLDDDTGQPPDHLCYELELLVLLFETGIVQQNSGLLGEAEAFAAMEMEPWVEKFSKRLSSEPDCRFYAAASRLLLSAIRQVAGV